MKELIKFICNKKLLAFILVLSSLNSFSQVDPVLQENKVRADNAAASQVKIDSFQTKTDKDASEYKGVTKQIEGLKVYNAQKKKQIRRQIERMEEIEETMKYAAVLQRQIPPLSRRQQSSNWATKARPSHSTTDRPGDNTDNNRSWFDLSENISWQLFQNQALEEFWGIAALSERQEEKIEKDGGGAETSFRHSGWQVGGKNTGETKWNSNITNLNEFRTKFMQTYFCFHNFCYLARHEDALLSWAFTAYCH